ncbi:MAG TPA: ABC transporter permease [Stackebrandtia sp.]|jgi:ABC-type transport system involved in multi-copper enzyme maturation permease subunit|uniref:ABC transporter permease n=1 Tax=Stackebrandtia sp. TaxID=2023065 RepID=UPI002D358577|nr:ABC transporter permease [Stackebrandtia sp.]HZE39182.1 ABC transporter permease [Stackebrandtia sp.]
MWASTVAELNTMVRRGANWLMLSIAVVLMLTFGYAVPYTAYLRGDSDSPATAHMLDTVLPDHLVGIAIGGLPFFTGAIGLIIGALAVGGEYGWGTWKTLLTQGPSRLTVYSGKLASLAVANAVLVGSSFAFGAASTAIIASVEDKAADWPSLADLATGFGAGWMIAMMWTMAGVVLAIATRGVAIPIGVGLVWMLGVQNLLAGIAAPLLDWVADLQKWLPGPNAGSLAGALGVAKTTPGYSDIVSSGHAVALVAAYLLVFAAIGGVVLRRRDVV